MLTNNTWKSLILILTVVLYSGSSYIIFKRNIVIKDKVNESIRVNEIAGKELKEIQELKESKLERLNRLKLENTTLRNELNYLTK